MSSILNGELKFNIKGRDKEYFVKELTVRQIINITQFKDFENISVIKIKDIFIKEILPKATNVTEKELLEMRPSEVEIIWKRFKEVNKVFFQLLETIDVASIAKSFKKSFLDNFSNSLAASSKKDIPESLTTDTAT